MNICREIERSAPNAIMLNHANPMAVLCHTMNKYSDVKSVIGICHGVQGGVKLASEVLGVNYNDLEVSWIGTNHYYWVTKMLHKGNNILPEFWNKVNTMQKNKKWAMCDELSHIFEHWILYPEDDHIIEFFPFASSIKDPTNFPYGMSQYGFGKKMKHYIQAKQPLKR